MEEPQLALGRHHEQPVRLRHPARDLGQELGPRNADGDREADLLEHPAPQPQRHLPRRAGDSPHAADVQERLVDGERLHQRRGFLEHRVDGSAGVGVGAHPRRHDDRVRAERARLPAAHGSADTVRPGLVAGGEDDPGADDDRAAPEPRVVPLLDRRVERVEVGVEDRRLVRHERMFADAVC